MAYKDSISLKITNNTNVKLPLDILDGNQSLYSNSDNSVLVEWDLSSEPFTGDEITLGTSTPITKPLLSQNIKGVVNVLNSMNVAFFTSQGSIVYATALIDPSVSTAQINIF